MGDVPKQIRRVAVALVASVAGLGGLIATAGTASADISGGTVALNGSPTTVLGGATHQAVAGWTLTLPTSLAAGDKFEFVVNPSGVTAATLDCQHANDIEFAGAPTVNDSQSVGLLGGAEPTFITNISIEPGTESDCTSQNLTNVLTITVVNPGSPGLLGPSVWTVPVTGITYNIGIGATTGPVSFSDSAYENGDQSVTTPAPGLVPSNATVTDVAVSSNNPPVGLVSGNDTDAAISPIALTESVTGTLLTGYTCVTLSNGSTFDVLSHSPSITATGGGAVVSSTVSHPAPGTLAFDVTTASSTAVAAFTLGNLFVDGGNNLGPAPFTLSTGSSSACAGGVTLQSAGDRAFAVYAQSRTAGSDSDATAALEMESVFPPPSSCPGTSGARTVVLATDENFPDALSASYLAGRLGTGLLLTPTAALSAETAAALRVEGITNVDVVGGPDAVSPAVLNTLTTTPIYSCGGTQAISPLTGMSVQVIAGATEYDTSSVIAQYFGLQSIGTAEFPGAYGEYNDTTGMASASGPSDEVPTAIVATGESFEDATSSSVMAYAQHFPVVLTTPDTLASQASASLINDQIKQVVLVGGPLAVSDNVVAQIQALGIAVLRVAGQDATDTAQELARFELNSLSSIANNIGSEGLGWDQNNNHAVVLARGDFYSDGLAGAPFAALAAGSGHPEPILLTFDPNTLGSFLTGFFNAGGSNGGLFGDDSSTIDALLVVGGVDAVTPATVQNGLNALSMG
ncbi:MAG TPA: cell wall-binding repeat-containing protein [Acidimicrobiales bacterium]